MPQKIHVGNLPLNATEADVFELFSEFGPVEWVHLVTARDTGRSRGKGFVTMSSGASKAIRALHRTRMGGRRLQVSRALPLRSGEISRHRTPKRARAYLAAAGGSSSSTRTGLVVTPVV